MARSVAIGIQNVVSNFEDSFLVNNLVTVKDPPVLSLERIRRAIAIGVLESGGRRYTYEDEVNEVTNILLNCIACSYQRIAGGADENAALTELVDLESELAIVDLES